MEPERVGSNSPNRTASFEFSMDNIAAIPSDKQVLVPSKKRAFGFSSLSNLLFGSAEQGGKPPLPSTYAKENLDDVEEVSFEEKYEEEEETSVVVPSPSATTDPSEYLFALLQDYLLEGHPDWEARRVEDKVFSLVLREGEQDWLSAPVLVACSAEGCTTLAEEQLHQDLLRVAALQVNQIYYSDRPFIL
jgi:hypothetical protein